MQNLSLIAVAANPGGLAGPAPADRVDYNDGTFLKRLEGEIRATSQKKALVGNGGEVDEPLAAKTADGTDEVAAVLAAFLGLLRQELTELAGVEAKGDGWSLSLPAEADLSALASAAGLDSDDVALLQRLAAEQAGGMDLDGFLAFFQRHLEALAQPQRITASETNLPTVETLLLAMGVDGETVARIDHQVVSGDDRLDLASLLQAVQDLAGQKEQWTAVELETWQRRQLVTMFQEAGSSETFLAQVAATSELDPAGLAGLLERGVADIQAQYPQPAPLAFVEQLQEILARAGLADDHPAWNPLFQKSLDTLHRQLAAMVDLATVKVSRLAPVVTPADGGGVPVPGTGIAGATGGAMATSENNPLFEEKAFVVEKGEGDGMILPRMTRRASGLTGGEEGGEEALAGPAPGAPPHVEHGGVRPAAEQPVRLPLPLERAVFQQVQQRVVHGLANREHHLVMQLHPPELGEVKVEMVVRDHQVALSFTMENQQVKASLESNMQEFRDNLARQGFTLGQCSVSVGHGRTGDQQRFHGQLVLATGNNTPGPAASVVNEAMDLGYLRQLRLDGTAHTVSLLV